MLIGDTSITCHGKKYRSEVNGHKNATPNPPLVNASNIPWEIKEAKENKNTTLGFAERNLLAHTQSEATMIAKTIE